jgi:hypothetical protein
MPEALENNSRKLQELPEITDVKKQVGGQFLKVERKGGERVCTGRPVKLLVRRNPRTTCLLLEKKEERVEWAVKYRRGLKGRLRIETRFPQSMKSDIRISLLTDPLLVTHSKFSQFVTHLLRLYYLSPSPASKECR